MFLLILSVIYTFHGDHQVWLYELKVGFLAFQFAWHFDKQKERPSFLTASLFY